MQFAKRTLFFLNRPSMPVVRPLTASSFCFIMPPRSSLTSPTVMPYLAAPWISCHKCDEFSRAYSIARVSMLSWNAIKCDRSPNHATLQR